MLFTLHGTPLPWAHILLHIHEREEKREKVQSAVVRVHLEEHKVGNYPNFIST